MGYNGGTNFTGIDYLGTVEYLLAREFTARVGQPLIALILLLSIALAVFAILPPLRKYSRLVALALVLGMAAGWLLLANLHYQIATSLALVDPTGQLPPGNFYIPPWVENEKFYFWTLVLALLTVAGRRRPAVFQTALNVTLGGFGILTYFTSNPFAQPLADFHAGFSQYAAAMAGGNTMVQSQAYHALHGKMIGFYNSTYMWIHPPMLFIAYSTFVLAFLGCVFMVIRSREGYDKLAYAWAKPGFILLTVGLLIGYPWAVEAWKGEPWWYDPKINVTLMMWLLYSAYLHARIYIHRKGMWTATAVLGYLAFLGVVVTYLSTYVLPGIHSVAG